MLSNHQEKINSMLQKANSVLLGKEKPIKLAISTLLANGHLLINDLPGVGKTTLANLIARLAGLDFQRIQFTSDLLPADITGVSIFNQESSRFEFHPGPVFAELVLADEINRATPKTQSALLEAMEERQVSVEGNTKKLPKSFFVIATQNPVEQAGTFPLPESQLDRFLLSIEIGYPDLKSERFMLTNNDPRSRIPELTPVLDSPTLLDIQAQVNRVHCAEPLLDYLQNIVAFTRSSDRFINGYSPRAAMGILNVSKAWAYIQGRDAVIPEDVQTVIPSTVHHLRSSGGKINADQEILERVAVP